MLTKPLMQKPTEGVPTVGAPVIGSDFSPASACAHPQSLQNPQWPELCPIASMLIMRLLWQKYSLSCAHPQFWRRPHSWRFRLSPRSQTKSSPQVCPLKPKFHHPVAVHFRHVSVARKCSYMAGIIYTGLSLPCRAAGQLPCSSLEPLRLPICPSRPPSW